MNKYKIKQLILPNIFIQKSLILSNNELNEQIMIGSRIRLKRLFGSGQNAVIVAIDHGMFDGPIAGLENMKGIAGKINPAVDGVLLSPGMLGHLSGLFENRGAPLAIVRVNWSSVYCFHWNYNRAVTVPSTNIKQAVAMGADAVLISLTLQTGSEEQDAKNVETYCRLRSEAAEYGLPVIGEYFPTQVADRTQEQLHEQVSTGCRILSELGADLIKTFYTHDFKTISSNIATPILGLGAEKKNTQREALQLASDEIRDGARGVVFGRNAIQVKSPIAFQSALISVVKNGMDPFTALRQFQLED
jgi:class I fructose-bisphosphate aldolase